MARGGGSASLSTGTAPEAPQAGTPRPALPAALSSSRAPRGARWGCRLLPLHVREGRTRTGHPCTPHRRVRLARPRSGLGVAALGCPAQAGAEPPVIYFYTLYYDPCFLLCLYLLYRVSLSCMYRALLIGLCTGRLQHSLDPSANFSKKCLNKPHLFVRRRAPRELPGLRRAAPRWPHGPAGHGGSTSGAGCGRQSWGVGGLSTWCRCRQRAAGTRAGPVPCPRLWQLPGRERRVCGVRGLCCSCLRPWTDAGSPGQPWLGAQLLLGAQPSRPGRGKAAR